jgi:hypothetical protein
MVSKVYQTDFSAGKGNALQACIASILEHPLDLVPNFIESPDGYHRAIHDYLSKNGGHTLVKTLLPNGEMDFESFGEPLVLAAGKSPRGDHKHVMVGKIIGKQIVMAHDPHPHGTGLDGKPQWVGFIVKL